MRLMLATDSTIYKDLCHYDVDLYNSMTAKSISSHLKFHEHENLYTLLESYYCGVIGLKLGHLWNLTFYDSEIVEMYHRN